MIEFVDVQRMMQVLFIEIGLMASLSADECLISRDFLVSDVACLSEAEPMRH